MPSTTLLLNGFSIIGDPHTNSAAAGGGRLHIHGGTSIFEPDDIIVFQVEYVTVNGVLTGESEIVGVIVYDHATDYYNDVPMFTYSGSADIDTGRRNMGDRYLEFDAGGLTSSDPGAPVLGDMAVVAGVDILGTLATTNGPLRVNTNETIDLNGDGIISPDEEGDGLFSDDLNILAVVCFGRGTLIDTPDGPRAIETLAADDMVNTLDNGPQPIRWIGSRRVAAMGAHAPVRIKPGALGNVRELVVSPNHRMLVSGAQSELLFGQSEVLVAAKHLVNDDSIRVVPHREIEYFHFLFDAHQIVFAECCPAESLFPAAHTLSAVTDESRAEIISLFPELEHRECIGDLSRYALKQYEARALRLSA